MNSPMSRLLSRLFLRRHLLHIFATLIIVAANQSLVICRVFADDLAETPCRPNVVLILADDLGWADLGCYGNTFNETPRIDRLAGEGVRFTQFYAGPVCSPTRANLQSGRDQARFGITQHIPGHRRPFARLIDPEVPNQLPLEVETFAERLAAAGYATGYFGKWHLGGEGFGPDRQGWQTAHEVKGNSLSSAVTGEANERRGAEFLGEQAAKFIHMHREEPFLLQVSYQAVHIPLSSTPELIAKYERKTARSGYPSLPAYAGLLEELDRSVGVVVDAVDRAGLADDTLILFLSDNGGLEHQQGGDVVTSNKPLRGEKGTLYEGGIRIPAIARCPNFIPAKSVCITPVCTQDVYPTLLELAGVKVVTEFMLDGFSLAKQLHAPWTTLEREALYWHLPHYHHGTPAGAIRRGDWKLIEFFETGRSELYDLSRDISEQHDLAAAEPARAAELKSALSRWRESVGAKMPEPNPNFDPRRAAELGKLNAGKMKK